MRRSGPILWCISSTPFKIGSTVYEPVNKNVCLCWSLLVFVGLCWSLLVFFNLCRSFLVSVGLYQPVSSFVGLHPSLLAWSLTNFDSIFGLCVSLLVFIGPCWSLLAIVDILGFISGFSKFVHPSFGQKPLKYVLVRLWVLTTHYFWGKLILE